MSFEQLNLSAEILRAIADQGYTEPTPIQAQAIPPILEGKDIMGGAQTGTGKTAGFTLPMLHRLQPHANTSVSPARHAIRALILVPTRELAAQVYESVKTYGKYLPLKCAVSLSKVEILILDEADRMLDMGFMPDIKRILALIPQQRQSLMFSATFSDEIKKLADKLLKQPVLIEVARRNSITELVTHVVHPVERDRKRDLLAHLIKSQDLKQVLVFVRTKHGASRLAQQLERDGITATAIHGDKSQPQRTQALAEFKQGAVRVLVATDVAARGLDIEDLPHVVNFELPTSPEDYIHRIGRTGRAGTKGDAISLVCKDENELLEGIQKLLKLTLNTKIIAGFEPGTPHHAPESESTRGRHERPERAASEQKRTSGPRVGEPNGAHPASRSPGSRQRVEHGGPQARRTKTPEDPLFSQPYTPSTSVADTSSTSSTDTTTTSSTTDKGHGHIRPEQQNKPLAALFRPRSPAKSKQDE